MKNFPSIGVQIPTILLPSKEIDQTRWAVIACDQFTSQPEYWQEVAQIVGDAPSTLHMILPEVFLSTADESQRSKFAWQRMQEYQDTGVLHPIDNLIYVERTTDGKTRRGIILALDLEKYDFSKSSQSLIRATEGTILDRLPPRMIIREGASLELPHILVLIDDPEDKVIGTVEKKKSDLPILYDTELMLGSGHLCGRTIDDVNLEAQVMRNLEALADPKVFYRKYQVSPERGVLLFAMGDGNHSLATAKMVWEKIKTSVGMDHPARYALVEIENIHDPGLEFEPIHRVLFHLNEDPHLVLQRYFGSDLSFESVDSANAMKYMVDHYTPESHRFGMITDQGYWVGKLKSPKSNLPVGSLEPVLSKWVKEGGAKNIDYVHGFDTVCSLGLNAGNAGFYLPPMQKSELFRTVILDGALPRKTFSMGEAREKRFYMEARKIV